MKRNIILHSIYAQTNENTTKCISAKQIIGQRIAKYG